MKNKFTYFTKYIFFIEIIVFVISCDIQVFSQGNGLPLLSINKTRFDFGKTKILETKCDQIVFKNIGDTVLTISSIDPLLQPFLGNIIFPDTLQKNDSIIFNICYRPQKASIDSQRVFFMADTRLSHSIGLLFDISPSMENYLPKENITRLGAAIAAGKNFINSMVTTPQVTDEAGVFSFGGPFFVNQDFTTDKNLLINSLPNTFVDSTHFYDACVQVINRLKLRPYQKVLIVLTDGADNRSVNYNSNDVINIANNNNIKIYTVGVGSSTADNILADIANSTGGQFFKANSSKDLLDIYQRIFTMLSKNITQYFDVLGNSSGADLFMDCSNGNNEKLRPGTKITFPIYLHGVSIQESFNNKYRLRLTFNKTLLAPINNTYNYNYNGILDIEGTNSINLDSLPLMQIDFMTFLGDSECTNLNLEPLTWEDNNFAPISSDNSCRVCMDVCQFDIRQITLGPAFTLYQSQPNPAGETTIIKFVLTYNEPIVTLNVRDMEGEVVATLIDGKPLDEGEHQIIFNTKSLPNGIYYYTISAGEGTQTGKLIILR
ncbi:MAG: VWA domain-containing protein [FCB group bacterium]|jgi:hypothetical protein